jgi:hypothetical protein
MLSPEYFFRHALKVSSCFVQPRLLFYVAFDVRRKESTSHTKPPHKKEEATKSIPSLLVPMTIEPPTKSIANGHDLASDGTPAGVSPEQSMTAATTTITTTTTTPSNSSLSDDELKRLRLQVLVCVEADEDRKEAHQNHEPEDMNEKLLNQGEEIPCRDRLAPSPSLDSSSFVAGPPRLSRNVPARPTNGIMTARPVPQEYRREKGVDQSQHSSEAGLPVRGPGAFPIRPTNHGNQDESTHHDDDDTFLPNTNDERNEPELLSDDPESALEAQVVPERDLNREVQLKMDAITIDPIAVAMSKPKNDAPNGHPGARRNWTLMITFGILMVLVAVGSAIGIVASKDKKESPPTIAPTAVSEIDLARDFFTPLSGNETLWDESSPQYKALWWLIHEDPAKMMAKMQDETESSSSMIVERYVMTLLYFATDGANWVRQANFLGKSSICDWQGTIEFGIQCNQEGLAVALILGTYI